MGGVKEYRVCGAQEDVYSKKTQNASINASRILTQKSKLRRGLASTKYKQTFFTLFF